MNDAAPGTDRALGFGVVAGLPDDLLEAVAKIVADLGYGSFWINDSGRPDADGIAGLAVIARAAPTLDLGVGVLPLDRRDPEAIVASVADHDVPLERLRLGVGSGGSARPLALVRDGVSALRVALPGARIFVSALGPRMSRLAGEIADGVLFNWAVPERLAEVSGLVDEGARALGRRRVERWAYVRAAIGEDARPRLADEAARYATNAAYGRAFEAMGVPFDTVGVGSEDLVGELRSQLAPYRHVLDGVVVRALPRSWTLEDVIPIARAAAPDPRIP